MRILELRKLAQLKENPIISMQNGGQSFEDRINDNLSYEIPKYPFVGVTRHDGERVYVRCHSELYEELERDRICKANGFVGIMGENFKTVWEEANALVIIFVSK